MFCFDDGYFTRSEQFLMLACGLRPLGYDFTRFWMERVENLFIRTKLILSKNWEGIVLSFQTVHVYRARGMVLLSESEELREFTSVAEALNHLGYFSGIPAYPPLKPALPQASTPCLAVPHPAERQ